MDGSVPTWVSRGVYTPEQAACLLGIRPGMVTRWIYGYHESAAPAVIPEFPRHEGKLVTFLDLIQAMAIRDIRRQKRLSLQKIRATVSQAKNLGVDFPFARRHTTYVFSDDVVLRLDDGRLVQVTGRYKKQDLMEPIIYEYLDDLGFDRSGLANIYTLCRLNYRAAQISPLVNYGAPTVHPCGYTVRTLMNVYEAEGSVDRAANICGVGPDDIRVAIECEKKLAA